MPPQIKLKSGLAAARLKKVYFHCEAIPDHQKLARLIAGQAFKQAAIPLYTGSYIPSRPVAKGGSLGAKEPLFLNKRSISLLKGPLFV